MSRYTGSTVRSKLRKDQEKAEALRLYAQGMTAVEIGKQLDLSYSSAYGRIREALSEEKSLAVEEYRKVQDLQLDAITEKAIEHSQSLDPDTSLKGLAMLLKTLERRARLHGLDAPAAIAVQGEVVTVSVETQERIEAARARLEAITKSAGPPALRAVDDKGAGA